MEEQGKWGMFTLACPSCGGTLQITDNVRQFACAHCGQEHIVRGGDGGISLTPIVEGLERVQSNVDKTTSELALRRLESEIDDLEGKKAQLERDLRAANSTGKVDLFLLAFSAGFMLLASVVLIVVDTRWLYVFITFAIGVSFMILTYTTWKGQAHKRKKQKKELMGCLDAVSQATAEKRAKLERHRSIVES